LSRSTPKTLSQHTGCGVLCYCRCNSHQRCAGAGVQERFRQELAFSNRSRSKTRNGYFWLKQVQEQAWLLTYLKHSGFKILMVIYIHRKLW